MKYGMIIDTSRCSLCYACVVACKNEFVGNAYSPYSYPQPDREHEWMRLLEVEKGRHPYVRVYAIPLLCMHCDKAPCIDACPIPDGIYRTQNGVVIIDPAKCNGCKACITACPYGVIFFNNDKDICQKCTLCIHKLEQGEEPACVDSCPSGVFLFGEQSKLSAEIRKMGAKWLHPEYGTKPKIFYIDLPSPSLAGHVISGQSLMDLPRANITITDTKTGSSTSRRTDASGNFLADDLSMDVTYLVKLECQGYLPKTIDGVRIDIEYKHLGDIKLFKA